MPNENENDNKLVNLADLKAAFDEVNDKAGVISVNGQTGAVSITPAKIGLGSATNNLIARNSYSGGLQTFGFSYTVDNSLNTAKNGHNMSLIIDNDDLALYDHTDNRTTWLIKPYNTRVKGNAESSFRTGDVNLTPANIGALAKEIDRTTFSDLNNTSLVGHTALTNDPNNTGDGYATNLPPGMTTGNKWYEVYLFGIIQMAIGHTEQGAFWVRKYTNGTWSNWQLIGGPTIFSGTVTAATNVTLNYSSIVRNGNVVTLRARVHTNATISGTNDVLFTVPEGFRPSANRIVHLIGPLTGQTTDAQLGYHFQGIVNTSGQVATTFGSTTIPSGTYVVVDTTYII